jgi:hypothetical protein
MKKLIATLAFVPSFAYAEFFNLQVPVLCGPTDKIFETLKEYKEVGEFFGIEDSGAVVTVWANRETGTYTIIKTSKTNDNISCVFGTGSTEQRKKL